jgi:WD40 repeat protein
MMHLVVQGRCTAWRRGLAAAGALLALAVAGCASTPARTRPTSTIVATDVAVRIVYTFTGPSGRITALVYGHDIASASLDGTVQVWGPATGAVALVYREHSGPVLAVAWSHDGRRLAVVTQEYCGDECGVVPTWDALNQQRVLVSTTLSIFAFAWSPDDRYLAGSAGQNIVQVYKAYAASTYVAPPLTLHRVLNVT